MATTNIREFSLALKADSVETQALVRTTVRATGLQALTDVIKGTRFDTGRMRGNNQFWEGTPPEGAIDRADSAGSEGTVDTLAVESRKALAASGDQVVGVHNGLDYTFVWEAEDKMFEGAFQAAITRLEAQGWR